MDVIHIATSTNHPRGGASLFILLDTSTILIEPKVKSQIHPQNIRNGRIKISKVWSTKQKYLFQTINNSPKNR
jgi:hypothetical protein